MNVQTKALPIRLFILDVDGTLTSGTIYHANNELEIKSFHIHDGLGIKLLQQAGIHVAIISGRHALSVAKRAQELNIQHVYMGHDNKLPAYEELKQTLGLEDKHIAYIGDDLPDLPLLRRAGLAITVPQAPAYIHQYVDFTTKKQAGEGAVREACELILEAQGKLQSMVESYLK